MARALRVEFEDAIYHVCARGNRRQRIFANEKDLIRFEHLLRESTRRFAIELEAYVLLPNHFHLLARTRRANLGRWMHWLLVGYSVWFNRRHNTSGHLFQGRYKSFLVEEGSYLLELSRYIHLNPVRGRLLGAGNPAQRRERLRKYRWSSYCSYAGLAKQKDFVSEALVLGELDGRKNVSKHGRKLAYRRFVEEGLVREIENPFEAVQWGVVLGKEGFAQRVRDKVVKVSGREVKKLDDRADEGKSVKEVLKPLAQRYRVKVEELLVRPRYGSQIHNMAMWLLWRRGQLTLAQIGALFGNIDYMAVSQRVRRLERRLPNDVDLRRACETFNV